MQMILVGAAVVSLAIKEWSTAVVLVAITLLNAVVGLRQQGKAESAMNALKSLMKETARVRRDGAEAEIPAEELVVGDIVLLTAGDQVPADGRLIAASSLQIDESALTGESTPGRQGGRDASRRAARPRRPDQHGVHAHAGDARQRRDDRDRHGQRHAGRPDRPHAGGHREGGDAAHEADEHAHAVDRRRGGADDGHHVRARPEPRRPVEGAVHQRRRAGDLGDPRGAAHGRPGRPLARQRRARRPKRDREGAAVRRDARVHLGDQLRQDGHADA